MTLVLGYFHTSDGSQPAIGETGASNEFETVVVFSETEADGLTPGQFSFKHNVSPGQEVGHFSSSKN